MFKITAQRGKVEQVKESPAAVEAYYSAIPCDDLRKALLDLRDFIRAEVPEADEAISYGIPTFRLHGNLVHLAAFKGHCSFFPGHAIRNYAKDLEGYKVSKGGVQFTPEKPLPPDVVRTIVRERIEENLARARAKGKLP